MNVQLIQYNIKQMEKHVSSGREEDACRTALALAKLILQTPFQTTSPRSLYGAYAGVAASLQTCFDTLLENYRPTEDISLMTEKIQAANVSIQECSKESKQISDANKELLDKENALEKEKKELNEKKKKIESLIELKNKEIPELKKTIQDKEKQLQDLEVECKNALADKEKWMRIFDENNRLIADLPDTVADKDADAIIAEAKAYALKAKQADEEGDEWLRKVITAVEQSKERMKDPANA